MVATDAPSCTTQREHYKTAQKKQYKKHSRAISERQLVSADASVSRCHRGESQRVALSCRRTKMAGVVVQEGCTPVATFSSHFDVCQAENVPVSFFQSQRVMAGGAVRRRLRLLRSTWRHEHMAIKMAIATCAHHCVQTAIYRPRVELVYHGISILTLIFVLLRRLSLLFPTLNLLQLLLKTEWYQHLWRQHP